MRKGVHFLLQARARTVGLWDIFEMSDDHAHRLMRAWRWPKTGGEPICPKCGCDAVYGVKTRRQWRCKACSHTFSVTSGTAFHSRKLPIQLYLAAVLLYANATKGISALQLCRDLNVQHKTAYVLAHKFREAVYTHRNTKPFAGPVEIDGCYLGGKPRMDRDKNITDAAKRKAQEAKCCILCIRQRGLRGAVRTLTYVVKQENSRDVQQIVTDLVPPGSIVYTDEHQSYTFLQAWYDLRQVNHGTTFSGPNRENINQAESYFSRFRRLGSGQIHRLNGKYLDLYANEIAYREDTRRWPNGTIWEDIIYKCLNKPSKHWRGYWQGRRRTIAPGPEVDLPFAA